MKLVHLRVIIIIVPSESAHRMLSRVYHLYVLARLVLGYLDLIHFSSYFLHLYMGFVLHSRFHEFMTHFWYARVWAFRQVIKFLHSNIIKCFPTRQDSYRSDTSLICFLLTLGSWGVHSGDLVDFGLGAYTCVHVGFCMILNSFLKSD